VHDDIDDAELHAYVDDELATERRIAVERRLAADPAAAARVAEYRRQKRLLASVGDTLPPPDPLIASLTDGLALRLGRRRPRQTPRWRSWAAAAACIFIGWGAHGLSSIGVPGASAAPVLADEAVEAYVAHLEEGRDALPDLGRLTAQLSARAGQPVSATPPELPGLTLRDAQWAPTDEGPGLQLFYEDAAGTMIALFLGVADKGASVAPQATVVDGVNVVYWQRGRVTHVLSGGATERLVAMAQQIDSL
jgi:anti-sigma factor RsiW